MANIEKYNKQYILEKTIEYIEKYGIEDINARDLAKFIGISTQPLFRNFLNMEDLKKGAYVEIKQRYLEYIEVNTNDNDYLLSISYNLIIYAKKYPNLFKTIFYSNLAKSRTLKQILESEQNMIVIEKISSKYNISKKESEKICRDIRFYAHGLANQIVYERVIIKDNEIKEILNDVIKKLLG